MRRPQEEISPGLQGFLFYFCLDQEDAKKNTILWVICGYSDPSQKQKIPKTQNQKMQTQKK